MHTVASTVLAHVFIPGSKRNYKKFQCVSLCCTVMVQSTGRNNVVLLRGKKVLLYCTFFDVHRAVHRNIISVAKPTRCTNVSNLFYFGNDAVHVSDGLSVHHQEFKTVHTATGICRTDIAVCLLAGAR